MAKKLHMISGKTHRILKDSASGHLTGIWREFLASAGDVH